MAKKKENIVITDKELTPTIIGKLDTKEKSPILLLFVFLIFIAVAIFLPDITNYVDGLLNGKTNNNKPTTNIPVNNNNQKNPDEIEEIVYYDYKEDLVISNDLFTISNIVVANNIISFNMKNNTENKLNLDELKYFLELYTSDTTLLQRIKISYGSLEKEEIINYSYEIDDNTQSNFEKLLVIKKTEDDYPEVTLNVNEENKGILICTKGYETITYTFANEYLTNISNLVNYPYSSDLKYATNLQNYQVLSATYNNYDGVSSTIVTASTGFAFTTLIDLKNTDIKVLDNNNYYPYRTLSKTVKFETESNGFSCN